MAGLYVSFRFEIGEGNKERQISIDFKKFLEDELNALKDGSTSSRVIQYTCDFSEIWYIIKEFLQENLKSFHLKDTISFIFYNEDTGVLKIKRMYKKKISTYSSISELWIDLSGSSSHQ